MMNFKIIEYPYHDNTVMVVIDYGLYSSVIEIGKDGSALASTGRPQPGVDYDSECRVKIVGVDLI